jgi:putative membrane protein
MHAIMFLIWSWILNFVTLLIVSAWLDGVTDDGTGSLLVAAAVFGVLNTVLKPLLKLVTLPLAVITLGLIYFVIAMGMLALTALIVPGFEIDGFDTLVKDTIAVWAVNLVLHGIETVVDRQRKERRCQ